MNVINEAYSWIKTPYHSGAKLKGVGVDCGQLLIAVYENAGYLAAGECDPGYYSPEWHLHKSEEKYLGWIERYCDPITGDPEPGDIVLFKFGRCVSHGGIFVGENKIIHAYVGMGVIESALNESLFFDKKGQSRLYGIYRPRQVGT
ncbi:NlpC/P60 family protein [Anaeromusa sp.]|uniref:NlpC/P60 family protein n=1 Tax=Anaeromusa sp. TaxID=1872520 RepID=UPI00260362C8|nr:NlpC/P60 family protein [Anaeromusa sp.]MDD3157659.1 NlpC/P60 family protein [Anaeromusa sp.]